MQFLGFKSLNPGKDTRRKDHQDQQLGILRKKDDLVLVTPSSRAILCLLSKLYLVLGTGGHEMYNTTVQGHIFFSTRIITLFSSCQGKHTVNSAHSFHNQSEGENVFLVIK